MGRGDEHAHRRAEPLDALVQLLDEGGELAARKRLDRDDAARRAVHLRRLRAHPVLEPELAKHLHRPKLEVPSPRMDRGAGVERVKELTGLDPLTSEDRERLGLGLKAYRIIRPSLPR